VQYYNKFFFCSQPDTKPKDEAEATTLSLDYYTHPEIYLKKKHKWFKLLRNLLLFYNLYKLYVEKHACCWERYYVQRICSLSKDLNGKTNKNFS